MNVAEIDEDGNFSYNTAPTEPQTPHSVNMGSPNQSNTVAWTSADGPAPGDSSVTKPSQTRRRQARTQSQVAKRSYLDLDNEAEDDDARRPHKQPFTMRQSQTLRKGQRQQSAAPEDSDSSPTRSGPRSSANASHEISQDTAEVVPNAYDDEEGTDDPDDDSPTAVSISKTSSGRDRDSQPSGRPSWEISLEDPIFASSRRMNTSQTASTVPVVDDAPKPLQKTSQKKELPFLSQKGPKHSKPSLRESQSEDSSEHSPLTKPSDIAKQDQKEVKSSGSAKTPPTHPAQPNPPQKLAHGMRGLSVMAKYKSTPKLNPKTRLSALELESDRSQKPGAANQSPFDYDNLPMLAGPSPGSTERKGRPKTATKKQIFKKYTKSKPSAKVKRAAVDKIKATERTAATSRQSAAAVSTKEPDDGDDQRATDGADEEEPSDTEALPLRPSRGQTSLPMKVTETIEISSNSNLTDSDNLIDNDDDDDGEYVEKVPEKKLAPRTTRDRASKKAGPSKAQDRKTETSSRLTDTQKQRAIAKPDPKATALPKRTIKASRIHNDQITVNDPAKPHSKPTAPAPSGVDRKNSRNRELPSNISRDYAASLIAQVAAKEAGPHSSPVQESLVPGSAVKREELSEHADRIAKKALIIPFGADGHRVNGSKRVPVNTQCEKQRSSVSPSIGTDASEQDTAPAFRPPTAILGEEHPGDCQAVPLDTQENFVGIEEPLPVSGAVAQVFPQNAETISNVSVRSLEQNVGLHVSSPLSDRPDVLYAVESQPADAMETSNLVLPKQVLDHGRALRVGSLSGRPGLKRAFSGDEMEDTQDVRQRQPALEGFAWFAQTVKVDRSPAHEAPRRQQPEIPMKKARLGVDFPRAVSKKQTQTFNGTLFQGSDDVFGPVQSKDRSTTDEIMVQRLRTMAGPHNKRAEPPVSQDADAVPVPPELQRKFRDRLPLAGGVPVARSGVNGRPAQAISPDSSSEDSMALKVVLNPWYHDGKRVDHSHRHSTCNDEQAPSPGPDRGMEEVMHGIVTVSSSPSPKTCRGVQLTVSKSVLQHLRSKSAVVHDVVDDYRNGCSSMVQTISNKHAQERQQLIEDQQQHKANYVQVCEDARRRVGSLRNELDAIQLDDAASHSSGNKAIARLKGLKLAAFRR